MINFQTASFNKSVAEITQLPPDEGREVAFIGRSNSGKSRSINTLTNKKQLARVSKRPGHTQLINFFNLSQHYRLVDLPGYGYASVSHRQQQQWQTLINLYLKQRQSLKGLVLLMDIRHPLQPADQQMVNWCIHHQISLHILLSKADKLGYGAAMNQLYKIKNHLINEYASNISIQLFSALKQQGIDTLKQKLSHWLSS